MLAPLRLRPRAIGCTVIPGDLGNIGLRGSPGCIIGTVPEDTSSFTELGITCFCKETGRVSIPFVSGHAFRPFLF